MSDNYLLELLSGCVASPMSYGLQGAHALVVALLIHRGECALPDCTMFFNIRIMGGTRLCPQYHIHTSCLLTLFGIPVSNRYETPSSI